MEINNNIFTKEELVEFKLRELFELNNYSRYKMSRFEEYDLYSRNKAFLSSDKIITFTDLDGKLLALKPDVTMSIVRHLKASKENIDKVYYAENVYRANKSGKNFQEIRQVGVEVVGNLNTFNTAEVIVLALKSLKQISPSAVLDVSHLKIVKGVLLQGGVPSEVIPAVLKAVSDKNTSKLNSLLNENSVLEENKQKILKLIKIFGRLGDNLKELKELCESEEALDAFNELNQVYLTAKNDGLDKMLFVDFSVINSMTYYDGIVFKGYINKIPYGVLSGGSYSGLAKRLGKEAAAIGFVVYLSELENL